MEDWNDSSVEAAAQCLKDLANSITFKSQDGSWRENRDDFFNNINKVKAVTDVRVLYEQLRRLENSVKVSKMRKTWEQWKRAYWRVITDPDNNLSLSVTRFIIALEFLEISLKTNAFVDSWLKSNRGIWLIKCSALTDSLMKLSFYDDMFVNVNDLLQAFGYDSLQGYSKKANNVISTINSAARKLDRATSVIGLADTSANVMGIVAGVVSGAGLVVAPLSAGASLFLTGYGTAMGVTSAVTSIASDIVQVVWDEKKAEEVHEETKKITAETLALTEMLDNYGIAAIELKTKLDQLGKFRALDYLKKYGLGGSKLYKKMGKSFKGWRMNTIVSQLRPDLIAAAGKDTLSAFAPGLKIPVWITRTCSDGLPKILVKGGTSLGSAAFKMSGVLTLLSLLFAVRGTIKGVKKITDGSKLAKEFRELADSLASAKESILQAYGIDA